MISLPELCGAGAVTTRDDGPIPKLNRGLDILFGAAKDAHGNWEMCGEVF